MSIGKQIIIGLALAVPLLMTHASYADEVGVEANTALTHEVLADTTLTQEVLSEQRKTNEMLKNINSNLTRLVTAQEAQLKEFEYLNTQISAVRTNSRDFEEAVMPVLQDIREILLKQ